MKVIISLLLSAGLVLCEVPPPYPSRGFRPNPPFNLPVRQPQTVYGVSNTAPPKFSQPSSPQIQYSVPSQQGAAPSPNLTPNFSSKQIIPSRSYGVPVTNNPYRTIINEQQTANQIRIKPAPVLAPTFNSKQTIPSTSYGVPVTSSPYRTITSELQVASNAPNRQNVPGGQYGAPSSRNVESLEQIRQLNLLLQSGQSSKSNQQNQIDVNFSQSQNSDRNIGVPSQQYLPSREVSNFGGDLQSQTSQRNTEQPIQQYLPVKEPTNFRSGFDLSQSNIQEQFGTPNSNLQQLSQQYLPVKDATNFENGLRQTALPQINREIIPASSLAGQVPRNLAPISQDTISNLNNYDTPQPTGIEIEQLNVRRLQNSNINENRIQNPTQQLVPRPAQPVRQNQEFGDSNVQGASRQQLNERYLPPTTTQRSVHRPTSRPATLPRDSSSEEEQSPESNEETVGGPNIAVATAVSGAPGGQGFYVLQPDGRLQRVIYQKTRGEGDRENEYTANYYFQNVQADPNLIYNPLIALGK